MLRGPLQRRPHRIGTRAAHRLDVHHAPLLDSTRAVLARRRRRRVAGDRRTLALGLVALLTAGGVAAGEVARLWTKAEALPSVESDGVLEAAEGAARQTVEVAVVGIREASEVETALLGVLASFTFALGLVRAATHVIHTRGSLGPVRNVVVGRHHIHHFVPGIAMAFLAGGGAILFPRQRLTPWLAVPFGVGLALTLDESALLLDLDDVYWTEEGIISVQIAFGALGILSALVLVLRLLRRGESEVLDSADPAGDGFATLSLVPDATVERPLKGASLAEEGGA
jgi:hypothetical protein